ncbi:hypothetical protein [Flavobacterium sp. WC2430]|uniref:hypothetical protein n=1 Tax=Flavobacterium sp. WC2430 TaxID=3234137 RepID=UPI003467619F
MKGKKWFLLTVTILISLHLKIAKVANFDISLAFVLIPFWVFSTFQINSKQHIQKELGYLALIFLLPFVSLNITNWVEFFNTYAQFVISYFLVVRAFGKPLKVSRIVIDNTLYSFQKILLIVVLIQFFFVIILGYRTFFNLFGEYQLYYQLDLEIAKYRMKGFYLEPSYLGFVCLNVYWTRLYLGKTFKLLNLNLFITLGILFFVNSAFAYVSLSIIVYLELLSLNYKNKASSLILFVIFLFTFIFLIFFSNDLFLFFRLNEFSSGSDDISSGFMRVTLPFKIVYKLIFEDGYYLGLTFGQFDSYVEKKMMGFAETKISNSFFLILGYFGLIGFIIYGSLILNYIKTNSKIIKSFIILSFLNLNNSGAFMTLQYVFVAFLLPFLAIKYYENKIINNNSSSQRQKWSNSNLQ